VKTVLILGGGIMQVPAVRIARQKGWRVVVADGNENVVARAMCDSFERVDLKDKEGMLQLARRLSAGGGLDGVFTAGTDFSATVAWVCERLGLPGISYQTAQRATDKFLMRTAFQAAGVPIPRFMGVSVEDDLSRLAPAFPFPVVVKPVDNMGARGVRRIDSLEQLAAALRAAVALSRSGRAIVEEFMDGPELSLDAIVYRGRITICGVADRHIRFPPYFVEMGHTMPTALETEQVEAAERVFSEGIRALEIDNGAAKGDIKLSSSGPMVGEIAARLSGGYMSGWTFPLSSGVEVTSAALDIAVGLAPDGTAPRWKKTSAERAFISIPGTIRGIEGVEQARTEKGVREIFLRVEPGSKVTFPTNNVEKCGNVISCLDSRAEAVAAAEKAASRILLRLSPENSETDGFLFSAQLLSDGWDAFTLSDSSNREALQAMAPFQGEPDALSAEGPIRICLIPSVDGEQGRDWHGLPLVEAIRRIGELCRAVFQTDMGRGDVFVLGSVFWRAILRGGVQGAVYLLDSIREASKRGEAAGMLGRICGA
jgi:biotin carboxylase